MKALVLQKTGQASIETVPEPVAGDGDILLKVRMVGFCGSDLNSFRGLNPLVSFPRIPGHEVSATVVQGGGDGGLPVDTANYTAEDFRFTSKDGALYAIGLAWPTNRRSGDSLARADGGR